MSGRRRPLPLTLSLVLAAFRPSSALSPAVATRRPGGPLEPGQLEEIVRSPHVGYFADDTDSLRVFVIGTSHLRCNSAREVTSLIERVRPDGVVLELDPERLIRLTRQQCGFDENGEGGGRAATGDLLYGADFAAAVSACRALDVPMFLGDEYAQETRRRLTGQLLDWRAYSPGPLVRSLVSCVSGDEERRKVRMNVLASFARDPQKLLPIAATSAPGVLVASAIALSGGGAAAYDGMAATGAVETILSVIASLLISSFFFNKVILERDEILAASTMKAEDVVRSLKEGKLIRKRWEFSVDRRQDRTAGVGAGVGQSSLPLFTLKNPLLKGATRNLNLFEPRWLRMIDEVVASDGRGAAGASPATFGCVRCLNKFYGAVDVDGVEGRYADVIFDRVGTLATIGELTEGRRPVSGDRRIGVSIEGGESFAVDESGLSVSDDGYMVADIGKARRDGAARPRREEEGRAVTMVVVVGLLHGNGIIDLLSSGYDANN